MSTVSSSPVPSTEKTSAKPRAAPTHPPVAEMVTKAIGSLQERKGCSLAAIKKYIAENYQVDMDRVTPFIRRFLKSAVTANKLVQTKGTGATGSFKLAKVDKPKKAKSPAKDAGKPKKQATKDKNAKKGDKKESDGKKKEKKETKIKKPSDKKATASKMAKSSKAPKKASSSKPAAKKLTKKQ